MPAPARGGAPTAAAASPSAARAWVPDAPGHVWVRVPGGAWTRHARGPRRPAAPREWGAYGFYPWIDWERDAHGVLEVYHQRGSTQAVPDSQEIVNRVWDALDEETGAPAGPPTTIDGR